MAEKPMNNFKSAVNDLMNGKVRTDDEDMGVSLGSDYDTAPFGVPSTYGQSSSDLVSILSSDIIIEGTVKSKSDLKLNGYIKGDVSCGGTVVSSGTVDGNIEGSNITLVSSTINGNINVRGAIAVDSNSSVTGDIVGTSLHSNGKVKGNIILKESVTLLSNATVFGNIKAKNIQIEAGSTLVGSVEIKAVGAAATVESAPAEPASADKGERIADLIATKEDRITDLLTQKEDGKEDTPEAE